MSSKVRDLPGVSSRSLSPSLLGSTWWSSKVFQEGGKRGINKPSESHKQIKRAITRHNLFPLQKPALECNRAQTPAKRNQRIHLGTRGSRPDHVYLLSSYIVG